MVTVPVFTDLVLIPIPFISRISMNACEGSKVGHPDAEDHVPARL